MSTQIRMRRDFRFHILRALKQQTRSRRRSASVGFQFKYSTSCFRRFFMEGREKLPPRRLKDSGFESSQRTEGRATARHQPVNYSNRRQDNSSQERFGRIPSTQQQPVNYNNRRQDDSAQERLEFDKDTGKLVVCRNPQAPQAASVHESAVAVLEVRAPVPDRPVVDAMAAQGFFYLKMMNVF